MPGTAMGTALSGRPAAVTGSGAEAAEAVGMGMCVCVDVRGGKAGSQGGRAGHSRGNQVNKSGSTLCRESGWVAPGTLDVVGTPSRPRCPSPCPPFTQLRPPVRSSCSASRLPAIFQRCGAAHLVPWPDAAGRPAGSAATSYVPRPHGLSPGNPACLPSHGRARTRRGCCCWQCRCWRWRDGPRRGRAVPAWRAPV